MIHLGDICKINGAEIEPVWVVTGGSPCQDLSIAGKRAGLAGARSGLFMEQVRIVKEMREEDKRNGRTGDMVRPRFLVWENVVGAFSSNRGKDFAAVLEEIARIAEPGFSLSGLPEKWKWTKAGAIDGDGWSIAWRTHDAKDWGKTIRDSRTGDVIRLGTPQRRRRISVVADFGGDTAGEILFERKSVSGHPAESGAARERLAGNAESGASYAVQIRGGCDGGGKGALVQEDKSGTLGTGNDQTISQNCLTQWDCQSKRIFGTEGEAPTLQGGVGGGVNSPAIFCLATQQGVAELRSDDRAPTLTAAAGMSGNNQPVVCAGFEATPINLMVATRGKALGRGTGFGVGEPGDPANTISAAHSHGVFATAIPINDKATRWQGGGESRNHDGSGNGLGIGKEGDPSPTLTAGDRHGVMCAGFKLGNSEQARSIGYQEELSHTLNAECGGNKPAVVALDMTHACDVIRECGEQAPSLQARMGTGGNQVPLTYQEVTGTLSPGAHAGSYNGQDAYNDMLVVSSEISPSLRAKGNDPYRADMSAYVASVDCRNFREGGEINGTLQAKESGGQSLNLNNTVRQNMVTRRLTPMECERLQGFPDGWTDIGEWTDGKGKRHKPSDSPCYKALGNSIALPFWDWMLRRMARYLPEGATLGSLFDGIGGFPLIWERIHGKGTARWASEIEPFPIAVTKKHFPEEE